MTRSRRSSRVPVLSRTCVATASRSSRPACAAHPRLGVLAGPAAVAHHPLDLRLHGHVDHEHGRRSGPPDRSRPAAGCRAPPGRRRAPPPRSRRSAPGSAGAGCPRAAGGAASSTKTDGPAPAGPATRPRSSTPSPNASTTAASPAVPGSTTSRASTSESMTTAPSSRQQLGHRALAGGDPAGQSHVHRRSHAGSMAAPPTRLARWTRRAGEHVAVPSPTCAAGDRVALLRPGSAAYVDLVIVAARGRGVPDPARPAADRPTSAERILGGLDPRPGRRDPEEQLDLAACGIPASGSGGGAAAVPADARAPAAPPGTPKGVWSAGCSTEPAGRGAASPRSATCGASRADDVNLVLSPLHHSAPLRFAMGTLLAGGRVVVPGPFDPATVTAAIDARAARPRCSACRPTCSGCSRTGTRSACPDLSSFRLVAHAGAACPPAVKRRLVELFPAGSTWEFYGSTEGQFTACRSEEWLRAARHRRPGPAGPRRCRSTTTAPSGARSPSTPGSPTSATPEKTAAAWRDTPTGRRSPSATSAGSTTTATSTSTAAARTWSSPAASTSTRSRSRTRCASTRASTDVAVYGVPDEQWGQRVCAAVVGDGRPGRRCAALARERLAPPKRPKT